MLPQINIATFFLFENPITQIMPQAYLHQSEVPALRTAGENEISPVRCQITFIFLKSVPC